MVNADAGQSAAGQQVSQICEVSECVRFEISNAVGIEVSAVGWWWYRAVERVLWISCCLQRRQ